MLGERTERHEALEELTAAVRRLVEATVTTGLPADRLRVLAGEADALAAKLEAAPPDDPWVDRSHGAGVAQPTWLMAATPAIGVLNPVAPVTDLRIGEDAVVRGSVRFTTAHVGPPGRVHGGMVATVLDQILGLAVIAAGAPGMTSSMTVRYRRATPLHEDLRIEASCPGGEGRAVGAVYDAEGRITADAEASFALPKEYKP